MCTRRAGLGFTIIIALRGPLLRCASQRMLRCRAAQHASTIFALQWQDVPLVDRLCLPRYPSAFRQCTQANRYARTIVKVECLSRGRDGLDIEDAWEVIRGEGFEAG